MTNVTAGTKGFASMPLEERFWAKVDKRGPDECWPWTGANDGKGYGQIWSNGVRRKATQVSWEFANHKPFPSGCIACHSCDNPPCVNPAHIWPGTYRDNTHDSVAKGRHTKTGNPGQRLTHCKRGHAFEGDNVGIQSGRWRLCRKCRLINQRKRRARQAIEASQ